MENLPDEVLTKKLAYAGMILVAFELIKSLVVGPIREFYMDTTFGAGMPFKSFEEDVMSRNKDVFEASLLYLRDFMNAIDSSDLLAIQCLRAHRNDLAHNLAKKLPDMQIEDYLPLLENATKALFKLSNYRTYIEIGADPEFQSKGINWETLKGHEYLLLEEVLKKVRVL